MPKFRRAKQSSFLNLMLFPIYEFYPLTRTNFGFGIITETFRACAVYLRREMGSASDYCLCHTEDRQTNSPIHSSANVPFFFSTSFACVWQNVKMSVSCPPDQTRAISSLSPSSSPAQFESEMAPKERREREETLCSNGAR